MATDRVRPSLPRLLKLPPCLPYCIDTVEHVRHSVADRVEPLTATEAVTPPLRVRPPCVLAKIEIGRPHLIAALRRRTLDVRGSTERKLLLIANATIRTLDLQHTNS